MSTAERIAVALERIAASLERQERYWFQPQPTYPYTSPPTTPYHPTYPTITCEVEA